MNKLQKRPKLHSRSSAHLLEHIKYLANPLAPSHKGKRLLDRRVYNYNGAIEDFSDSVVQQLAAYKASRSGKRGKRSDLLWGESIYSGVVGTFLTDRERKFIERSLLVGLFQNVPRVTCWHVDKTGRSDLHILFGRCTCDRPPLVFLSRFGAGNASFHFAGTTLEKRVNKAVNRLRKGKKQLLTVQEAQIAAIARKGTRTIFVGFRSCMLCCGCSFGVFGLRQAAVLLVVGEGGIRSSLGSIGEDFAGRFARGGAAGRLRGHASEKIPSSRSSRDAPSCCRAGARRFWAIGGGAGPAAHALTRDGSTRAQGVPTHSLGRTEGT